jgi:hypothetical protein
VIPRASFSRSRGVAQTKLPKSCFLAEASAPGASG